MGLKKDYCGLLTSDTKNFNSCMADPLGYSASRAVLFVSRVAATVAVEKGAAALIATLVV